MSASSLASGRFTAGQIDVVNRPRLPVVRPTLIGLHSAANTPVEFLGFSGGIIIEKLTSALVDDGFTLVAPYGPGYWGNGTAANEANTTQGRATDALTYSRSTLNQSTNPPIVIGASMGSLGTLRYAALHPVACAITLLTVCHLTPHYDSNYGGFRSQMEAAYGVTYPTPLPSGADPYRDLMGTLSTKPLLCHYSSDDTWSVDIVDFGAQTGAQLVNAGALGHTDASMATLDVEIVRAFIHAHL